MGLYDDKSPYAGPLLESGTRAAAAPGCVTLLCGGGEGGTARLPRPVGLPGPRTAGRRATPPFCPRRASGGSFGPWYGGNPAPALRTAGRAPLGRACGSLPSADTKRPNARPRSAQDRQPGARIPAVPLRRRKRAWPASGHSGASRRGALPSRGLSRGAGVLSRHSVLGRAWLYSAEAWRPQ